MIWDKILEMLDRMFVIRDANYVMCDTMFMLSDKTPGFFDRIVMIRYRI